MIGDDFRPNFVFSSACSSQGDRSPMLKETKRGKTKCLESDKNKSLSFKCQFDQTRVFEKIKHNASKNGDDDFWRMLEKHKKLAP